MAESGSPNTGAAHAARRYRVATVTAMTGVPANTLRSWERRYGLPSPARSDTGQRLYSDHDVAVIRFLTRQLENGVTIGQAVRLLTSPAATDPSDHAQDLQQLPAGVVAALRRFDEATAEQLFDRGLRLLGLEATVGGLVGEVIGRVADDPAAGSVEAEHHASNFLRGQLLRLLGQYPAVPARPLLVGCGPDEQHELAALGLAVLLAARGRRVVYLGARLPCDALHRAAATLDAVAMVLSVTMPDSLEQAVAWHDRHEAPTGGVPTWWGGPALSAAPQQAAALPGRVFPGDIVAGATLIDDALTASARRAGPD